MASASAPAEAPSWALLTAEPLRALLEFAGMHLMDKAALPRGNGEPVVIFPGLAADRRSTAPLKSFCEGLGYTAYDWGRGFNTGPEGNVAAWLSDLARHVHGLTAAHEQRVSLIGWSLGGIYAREVAKLMPAGRVRQVITIGTPLSGSAQTNVGWVFRLLSGQKPVLDATLTKRLGTPPDVPTTAIYSRSDGVVAWQDCVQRPKRKHLQNVEVQGSHVGMGWNPRVLSVIGKTLRAEQ